MYVCLYVYTDVHAVHTDMESLSLAATEDARQLHVWLSKYCYWSRYDSLLCPRAIASRDEVSAGSSRVIIVYVILSFTCPLLIITTVPPQLPENIMWTAEVKINEISRDCAQCKAVTEFQCSHIS
jgi:hypothetical protein